MGNHVIINCLELKDLSDGKVTLGIRISDDYCDYINDYLEAIPGFNPQDGLPKNPEKLFSLLCELSEVAMSLALDDLVERAARRGATIWGEFIPPERLSAIYFVEG